MNIVQLALITGLCSFATFVAVSMSYFMYRVATGRIVIESRRTK